MSAQTDAAAEERLGRAAQADAAVSPLELFSDLIFVFAITQLTTVLVNDRTLRGLGHVLLLFGMIWWIYGGYVWLTNAVRPDRPLRKLLLLGAMVGFLLMGLAIPRTFEGDGVVFGLGYLVVVVIHAGLFTQAKTASTVAGIVRVAPFNVCSAILLIIAGTLSPGQETVLWVAALSIQVFSPLVTRTSDFRIEPGHFVERYGLLVLIALGESVVATGAGGRGLALDAATVVTSVLGLALTAAFWWMYFVSDAPGAEEALRATAADRRPIRALSAFFYAQIPMLLGVVAIAAAIRTALPQPLHAASESQALLLAGGVAAFLVGDQCFRLALGLPRATGRLLAVPASLATAAVGMAASPVAQLGLLAAALSVVLGLEMVKTAARSGAGHAA